MSGTLDLHARLRAAIAQQDMEAATALLRQAAALYTDGGKYDNKF
jgi:DNA-binding GntR family transcriptional regulator